MSEFDINKSMDKLGFGKSKDKDRRRKFTRSQEKEIWVRQNGRCAKCGRQLNPKSTRYDHIIPFSKNGKTILENGQALCSSCHDEKTADEILAKVESNKKNEKSKSEFEPNQDWGI